MYTKELRFMRRYSLEAHAFSSSNLLIPYLDVVKAAGWLLDLSNGSASSALSLSPT
jgi:hypothetical protein